MTDRATALGPVQVLVIAFEGGSFEGAILDELRRLRERDIVRLIDLLFVAKDERGDVALLEQTDLSAEESAEFGALVGTLIGLGADGEEAVLGGAAVDRVAASRNGSLSRPVGVWFLADAIPAGTSAAVALIEHRWAIPLRDAIESAGGHDLADHWIHPEDLV
jgi:uncharacterized membrane protein